MLLLIKNQRIKKRNILHYLVNYCGVNPIIHKRLLEEIKKSTKININKQDINGNTPLHVAVNNNNNVIARILEEKGADKSIKNNNGDYVVSDSQETIEQNIREDTIMKHSPEKTIFLQKQDSKEVDKVLQNIIKQFSPATCDNITTIHRTSHDNETADHETNDQFKRTNVGDERDDGDRFIENLFEKLNQHSQKGGTNDNIVQNINSQINDKIDNKTNLSTETFVSNIMSQIKGGDGNGSDDGNEKNNLEGGSNKMIFNRKISSFADSSIGGASSHLFDTYNDSNSYSAEYSEFARAVKNQKMNYINKLLMK